MLDLQQAKAALRKLFGRDPAAKLAELRRVLKTGSRTSVFRRLKAIGYFSSFTHRGRYYTLREIPRFDSLGLWRWRDVGFSKAGSLKSTVRELVEVSPAGRTHRELQGLLGVRAHNELLDLTRAQKLRREAVAPRGSLYVSSDKSVGAKQLACRKARGAGAASAAAPLGPAMVIEVLLELVRMSVVEATPLEVARRLCARGHPVTAEHVRDVFDRYKLGGKKGVRSPRLRR
jgi:hypothetical protein